jgi:hypothetical protein
MRTDSHSQTQYTIHSVPPLSLGYTHIMT